MLSTFPDSDVQHDKTSPIALSQLDARSPKIGTAGMFEFLFGSKFPKRKMKVHYFLPTCWTISTPVLFVMHGVKRDGDKYFAKMLRKDLPQKHGFSLICPEFSKELFPSRAGYNSGNVFRKENTKRLNDFHDWGFTALELIFDEYLASTGSSVNGYYIYGHSAGAQFVHRHVAFMGAGGRKLRVIKAVAANAGFYTLPNMNIKFPFGFGGTDAVFNSDDLRTFLQGPLAVLLGEEDNDPMHKHLNRSDRAMEQGPHRLARGQHFFEAGLIMARELGVDFGWQLLFVPGVGHSDSRMSRASVQYLFPGWSHDTCSRPTPPSESVEASGISVDATVVASDGEEDDSSSSSSEDGGGGGTDSSDRLSRDASLETLNL